MSIELKYWAGRGLMEVPRMLLAISGKFPPGDYTDGRYTSDTPSNGSEPYADVKDTLTANLGRMPLLSISGVDIGQSVAINYTIAAEFDLLGSSLTETGQILAIQAHLGELKTAHRGVVAYGSSPTDEQNDKWFDSGATDVSPAAADMGNRAQRFLGWWMGRIEAVVGTDFAVGSKLTLADVLIYNTFAEFLSDEQAGEKVAQYKREPFGSKVRTDAALEKHPKLKSICTTVAANANVQKWLSMRGVQLF